VANSVGMDAAVACLEIQLRNARLYGVEVECLCNEYQQRLIQVDQGLERTGGWTCRKCPSLSSSWSSSSSISFETWLFERTAKIFSLYLGELMTLNEQRAENPLFQYLHLPNPNISRSHNMYSYVYEYSNYLLTCDR